ncbi:hypothetical protein CRYUN_Cryun16bG0095000 [Craigia yunnanensis]
MRQHLQDLHTVGRQMEESGVLNESLSSRSNSWGLHMTLALKAFTDRKRRFFPHLDDEQDGQDMSNLKVLTYEKLDWLKRASSLPASANDNSMEAPKQNFHSSSILRPAPQNVVAMDKVAVIELLFPSIFRAVASLHPAGSTGPDSVAFFSLDEGGSYIHVEVLRYTIYIYRHITFSEVQDEYIQQTDAFC